MEPVVNFPPRHERLGVREHTRPACRFDQLSSARASVARRRNEVGPLELASLYFGSLTRETRMLLYCVAASAGAQATSFLRRQNLISKSHSRALARRFKSRSPVQSTVILDSTGGINEATKLQAIWSPEVGRGLLHLSKRR
jgi:hypothetical protein